MELDDIDIKILKENFCDDTIRQIDTMNLYKIIKYLKENNIDYIKDLFLSSLDLFLLPYEYFINKFERLKVKLGDNFIERLENDISLFEIMYED